MLKTNKTQNYYITEPTASENTVEAWSTSRLPFEPKGWLLELRNSLKKAILKIEPSAEKALYAMYTTDKLDYCDVENALLYNVGTGAFSNLCKNSICIERQISPVTHSFQFENKMDHHYFYSANNIPNNFQIWQKKNTLACWKDIKCGNLRGNNKPHTFWYTLKKAQINLLEKYEEKTNLGIEITIKSPKNQKYNLSSIIKPLIDGVVSAFHTHNKPTDYVIEKLSNLLNENPMIIKSLLTDNKHAILGERNLISKFMNGVIWNPADELFLAIKITNDDDCLEGTDCLISGEIFTIE